jgi:hypothetical protein
MPAATAAFFWPFAIWPQREHDDFGRRTQPVTGKYGRRAPKFPYTHARGVFSHNAEHLLRLLLQSLTSARRSAGEQLRVQQLNKMID